MFKPATLATTLAALFSITLVAVVVPTTQARCISSNRNCKANEYFDDSYCMCRCNAGYVSVNFVCAPRRRLGHGGSDDGDRDQQAKPVLVDKTAWDALKAECGKVQYQVSVYVEGHIGLVAEPIQGDTSRSSEHACAGSLFIHHGLTGKEIWTVDTSKKSGTIDRQSMYTLATYSLSDLGRAYDEVQLRGDVGPSSRNTDVVQLNCADFVADLAKDLGVQVTRDVTVFVARRLLKHSTSSSLIQEIRDNMGSFDNLAGATDSASRSNMPSPNESTSDGNLVEYLVETRTGKLY